jgi:hypothetical protein
MKLTGKLVALLVSGAAVGACPLAWAAVDVAVSLQDAVKQGKVDVQVSSLGGATGNTIRVDIQRKVPEKLQIKITPGTVFIAQGGKVQNMAGGTVKGEYTSKNTYRPTSVIVLADSAKHSYLVESFCLDYHKPAPKPSHSFSLALADQRASRILDAPKDSSASLWALQCALWMDRSGVTGAELKKRFPGHVTDVDIRVAQQLLRHAEETGIAEVPDDIPADVRVEVNRLFSSQPEVRAQAVKSLAAMGERAAPAIPFVAVNVINPKTGTTRVEVGTGATGAAQWLEAVGLPSLGVFVDVLSGEGGTSVSVEASDVLRAIRTARVNRLTANLKHPNPRVRQRAARVLGSINDPRAVEPLIAAVQDQDPSVRQEAAAALATITGKDFGQDHAKWQSWWQENKKAAPQTD